MNEGTQNSWKGNIVSVVRREGSLGVDEAMGKSRGRWEILELD